MHNLATGQPQQQQPLALSPCVADARNAWSGLAHASQGQDDLADPGGEQEVAVPVLVFRRGLHQLLPLLAQVLAIPILQAAPGPPLSLTALPHGHHTLTTQGKRPSHLVHVGVAGHVRPPHALPVSVAPRHVLDQLLALVAAPRDVCLPAHAGRRRLSVRTRRRAAHGQTQRTGRWGRTSPQTPCTCAARTVRARARTPPQWA